MKDILLVEDDAILAYGLQYTLKEEGFEVTLVHSLKGAFETFTQKEYDLVLLDVNLPDGTGYDFCKEIRKTNDIPIIFLTASDEEVNIVLGLDIGGDDYITKPFKVKELISRIKAVLRRKTKTSGGSDIVNSGDIRVYLHQGRVEKNGQEIILTALEYRLLLTLIKNSEQIISRNKILEGLWDIDGEFVDDNTLSVYVRRLREKIEDNPAVPQYIVTARGAGYKWNCKVI